MSYPSATVRAVCALCGDVSVPIDRCRMTFPRDNPDLVVVSLWDDEEHPVEKPLMLSRHADVIRTLAEEGIPLDMGDLDAEMSG